jgi:REP element-mobilizing transposase RayT
MNGPSPLEHGKVYHIYNRGINRETIFIEERDFHYFLKLYEKHIVPIANTFAYCLLGNHFHFLLRIKNQDEIEPESIKSPSQHFSNLFNAYAKAINKAYERTGSLFQRPFRRKEIVSKAYFTRLLVYIHRNPQKHGFVDDFRDWPFSSYHLLTSHNPTPLAREETLNWFGDLATFEELHLTEPDLQPLELDN